MTNFATNTARPIFLAVGLGQTASIIMLVVAAAVALARAGLALLARLRAVRRDVAELPTVVALLHTTFDLGVRALGGDVALLAAVVLCGNHV